jgi:hypothetical protein
MGWQKVIQGLLMEQVLLLIRPKSCYESRLYKLLDISEFTGTIFQAAQLTHERFLTIDHSCKMFF